MAWPTYVVRLTCAGLLLGPTHILAQPAPLAHLPAGPTTVERPPNGSADGVTPELRPSLHPSVFVLRKDELDHRRYTMTGSLIGGGVGLVVGLLAYRNNERKCNGCPYNSGMPVLGMSVGAGLGYLFGSLVYLSHKEERRRRESAR